MPINTATGVLKPCRRPDRPLPAGSMAMLFARNRSLNSAVPLAKPGTASRSWALICL